MRSDMVKKGDVRAPNRALLYGTGLSAERMRKPFVGIASSFTDLIPGHIGLRDMERFVERGICYGGGVPFVFGIPGVCDGIAMNHAGMRFSLASRETIADSVEIAVSAHAFDAVVLIPNCDKVIPGMLMAAARLDLPTIVVSGERVSAVGAALANGFAQNALDIDDGYRRVKGHPGAAFLPALLAALEVRGSCAGSEFLTALVVGGRLCANYAAELGTMKVTEQLDAMEMLAVDPLRYLALPRLVAAVLMLPVITIYSLFIGFIGGVVVVYSALHIAPRAFYESALTWMSLSDVYTGVIKTFAFALIIALVGCFNGFNAQGGAAGCRGVVGLGDDRQRQPIDEHHDVRPPLVLPLDNRELIDRQPVVIIGRSEMAAGLNEGLKMLKPGGEAVFIIPPFLAYGLKGDGNKIPARSIIVYEIKMINKQ